MLIKVVELTKTETEVTKESVETAIKESVGIIVNELIDSKVVSTETEAKFIVSYLIEKNPDLRLYMREVASDLLNSGTIEFQ